MTATILVGTWGEGLFAFTDEGRKQEQAGRPVRGLTPDGRGGALAVVDGRSLCRRGADGSWSILASSELDLACCLAVGDEIFAGTDDARLLRLDEGGLVPLDGFEATPGREGWYAGTAVIGGQVVGPPLGIRSLTATADGGALLANVHVGGIPRSTDGGLSWEPTLDVDNDVHQVLAHPTRPEIVVAAAATGLCVSRDGGATWDLEQDGLHATYCSAVGLAGDDVLVAAAADHFAPQGAVYRRPLDEAVPLAPVGAGLPRWIDGIADTDCIAATGSALAVADKAGHLYVSSDGGKSWSRRADGLPGPSCVLILS